MRYDVDFGSANGKRNRKTLRPLLPRDLLRGILVVEELIPESQRIEANIDQVTMATMAGFAVMMLLDVALGQ